MTGSLTMMSSWPSSTPGPYYSDDGEPCLTSLGTKRSSFLMGTNRDGRRSLPSAEKGFSSFKGKLPFDHGDKQSGSSTSSSTDLAVQKIECIVKTFQQRSLSPKGSSQRFSEPSLLSSNNVLLSQKLSALRSKRRTLSDDADASEDQQQESRARVLTALGRASEIIKGVDKSSTESSLAEEEAQNQKQPEVVVRQFPTSRQRRCGVFNLCHTLTMEHDEAEGGECGNESEEPLSCTSFEGYRLSEPRPYSSSRRMMRSKDVSEPSFVVQVKGRNGASSSRKLVTLLERYDKADEMRQTSSASSVTSSSSSSSQGDGERSTTSISSGNNN